MFEGWPLSEIGHQDLKTFLEERREEGVRLDYKREWGSGIVKDACAMANTSGGDILVGVNEIRNQKAKINRPDPENVPGIDRSAKDWKASVAGMIRSRTRPPVVPEVALVDLPNKPSRAVMVIRVEESLDAPHEVHVSSSPEIPVRRGDSTESAGLDDIERLIYQRDRLRRESGEPLDIQFYSESFGGPLNTYGERRTPPVVGVAIRPRRMSSLNFGFDSSLDDKMRQLAFEHHILDLREALRPTDLGVSMQRPGEGTPEMLVEVHATGTIRGAKALSSSEYEAMKPSVGAFKERELDFGEIVSALLNWVRFAGATYALKKPGIEMEVMFGLSLCLGCRITLPESGPYPSYTGVISHGDPMRGAVVKTDWEMGHAAEDDLLLLVREVSRFFGVSAPDDRLRKYV